MTRATRRLSTHNLEVLFYAGGTCRKVLMIRLRTSYSPYRLTSAQKAYLDHSRAVRAEMWERIGDHNPR